MLNRMLQMIKVAIMVIMIFLEIEVFEKVPCLTNNQELDRVVEIEDVDDDRYIESEEGN